MLVILAMACRQEPHEGTIVGNPVKTMTIGSPGAEDWEIATASLSEVVFYGEDVVSLSPGVVDLAARESFEAPEGGWERIELRLDAPLSFAGPVGNLSLEIHAIEVLTPDALDREGCFVLEIGQPGWLDDPTAAGGEALMADTARFGSALFADEDCSGAVDDEERVPLLTGVGHPEHTATVEPFFAAGGTGGWRQVSFDRGATWGQEAVESEDPPNIEHLIRDFAYGKGRLVGVGGTNTARAFRTFDGSEWEQELHDTGTGWNSVAFGEGRFVAVGNDGARHWSPDGLTWVSAVDGDLDFHDVAYGDGRFIAVGNGGTIEISVDGGETWVEHTSATLGDPDLYTVAHGDGATGNMWVAGGGDGIHIHSRDGSSWQTTGWASSDVHDIEFDGERFIAVSDSQVRESWEGEGWTGVPNDAQIVDLQPGSGALLGIDSSGSVHVQEAEGWTETLSQQGALSMQGLGFFE